MSKVEYLQKCIASGAYPTERQLQRTAEILADDLMYAGTPAYETGYQDGWFRRHNRQVEPVWQTAYLAGWRAGARDRREILG